MFTNSKLIPEIQIQTLWQNQPFTENLTSLDGKEIQVIFPGWYNQGSGPDFKDARIKIDELELFGDIEIHINEQDWYHHQHHTDTKYNKVILHVFIEQGMKRALNYLQQAPQSCCLPVLEHSNQSKPEHRPGKCSLIIKNTSTGKLLSLIQQAAERRLMEKAAEIESKLVNSKSYEQVLFALILRSLGAPKNSTLFTNLADLIPYQNIIHLTNNHSLIEAKNIILGKWFKAINLFNSFQDEQIIDELRRDWTCMKNYSSSYPVIGNLDYSNSRPQNHPIRKLTGLFYHIDYTLHDGLLKSWLAWFFKQSKNPKGSLILKETEDLFPLYSWEPLSTIWNPAKKSDKKNMRWIGRDTLKTILINAILPFFLAWSTKEQNERIKKDLFKLWLCLPAEASNYKTRFMEQRMDIGQRVSNKKNIAYNQGLIHLHETCCHQFKIGCENCTIIKFLS